MNNFAVNATSEAYNLLEDISILDACIYSISVLFGLPTHSYVLWLIVTGTRSGVASEFFNLNLSVCEIGICLNSLLSLIYFCTGLKHIQLAWLLFGLTVTGRPLFQSLICVERYLAVVHPVTFLKSKPLRYRVICCTVVWIITLGSCLCCIFIVCPLTINAQICFLMLQYPVFLCIQLFCLMAILRALKQSGPGDRRREEENHMKRRAFYLILITTVTMSFIYVPCIISGFSFFATQHFIFDLFSFGFICFILAGFVQPVLYLHRAGKLFCLFFSIKDSVVVFVFT